MRAPILLLAFTLACSDPERSTTVTFVEPVEGSETSSDTEDTESESESEAADPEYGEAIEIGEGSEADAEADADSDSGEGPSETAMVERIERIEQVELERPTEVVRRCRYSQACIIESLRGRTDSPQALGILAEAQAASGDQVGRDQTIQTLKRLYPESSYARMY